jgi:hypothetical protein
MRFRLSCGFLLSATWQSRLWSDNGVASIYKIDYNHFLVQIENDPKLKKRMARPERFEEGQRVLRLVVNDIIFDGQKVTIHGIIPAKGGLPRAEAVASSVGRIATTEITFSELLRVKILRISVGTV